MAKRLSTKALPNSNGFNVTQVGVGGAAGPAPVQAANHADALRVAQGIYDASGVPQSTHGMAPSGNPRTASNPAAIPNPGNPATETLHPKPGREPLVQDPSQNLR